MASAIFVWFTRIKWTLPALYIVGYLLTFPLFDAHFEEYLMFNLLAVFTSVAFLWQVKTFEQRYVAAWIAFLVVNVVYFLRFYWIAIDPLPVRIMLPWNPYVDMVSDREALLEAFKLTVISFVGFSVTVAVLLPIVGGGGCKSVYFINDCEAENLAKVSLVIITLLMCLLAYVTYQYHIGEMGASSGDALPFRLKGIIFYARTIFIPLVLLLSIHFAERNGQTIISRLGVLILITHGVMDMLLRSSRSSLLLVLLLLVFLILIDGIRLRRKEKMYLGAVMMFAFMMVPVITEYRRVRIIENLPPIESFFMALHAIRENGAVQFLKGLQFVLFRMPGVESLWCMMGAIRRHSLDIHAIDVLNSKNGVAGYLTYVVYPLKETDNTLLAPGFVGWFYLVGGLPAIILGSVFAGALSVIGWRFLDRSYIKSWPVAQVFFLWMLFMALTEGTLDSMKYMFFVGLMTIMLLEIGLRVLSRRHVLQGLSS